MRWDDGLLVHTVSRDTNEAMWVRMNHLIHMGQIISFVCALHHVRQIGLATRRAYALVSVVSTTVSATGADAAGNPPDKVANIIQGNPPLYINNLTRLDLLDASFTTVRAVPILPRFSHCMEVGL